jgi:hypothetical protein
MQKLNERPKEITKDRDCFKLLILDAERNITIISQHPGSQEWYTEKT